MTLSQKIAGAAARTGSALSKFRGRPFADHLSHCAKVFQQGLDNVNFDMSSNGEGRVLKVIASHDPKCLFDVGANVGEWTSYAARLCPKAEVHAFEVVPSTFVSLETNVSELPHVIPNSFGLSDEPGEIIIYLGQGSEDATACPIPGFAMHAQHYGSQVRGTVRTGSAYLKERRVQSVDFLKIDVEGMDLRVIKGFGDDLRRVRALQFEYGVFNIGSHDLLADFCDWLTSRGFAVGKVFPRTVQFFDYGYEMENFHGSNFVAVREDQASLIRDLCS